MGDRQISVVDKNRIEQEKMAAELVAYCEMQLQGTSNSTNTGKIDKNKKITIEKKKMEEERKRLKDEKLKKQIMDHKTRMESKVIVDRKLSQTTSQKGVLLKNEIPNANDMLDDDMQSQDVNMDGEDLSNDSSNPYLSSLEENIKQTIVSALERCNDSLGKFNDEQTIPVVTHQTYKSNVDAIRNFHTHTHVTPSTYDLHPQEAAILHSQIANTSLSASQEIIAMHNHIDRFNSLLQQSYDVLQRTGSHDHGHDHGHAAYDAYATPSHITPGVNIMRKFDLEEDREVSDDVMSNAHVRDQHTARLLDTLEFNNAHLLSLPNHQGGGQGLGIGERDGGDRGRDRDRGTGVSINSSAFLRYPGGTGNKQSPAETVASMLPLPTSTTLLEPTGLNYPNGEGHGMYMHMHQQSPQAMTAPSRPPRSPPRYAEVKASSRGESRNYRFTYDMPRDEVADEQPENHNPVSDSPPKQWFSSRREAEIVQHHLMAQPLPQVPVGLPHNELVKVAKQRHLLMDTYDKKTGLFSHDPYHHREEQVEYYRRFNELKKKQRDAELREVQERNAQAARVQSDYEREKLKEVYLLETMGDAQAQGMQPVAPSHPKATKKSVKHMGLEAKRKHVNKVFGPTYTGAARDFLMRGHQTQKQKHSAAAAAHLAHNDSLIFRNFVKNIDDAVYPREESSVEAHASQSRSDYGSDASVAWLGMPIIAMPPLVGGGKRSEPIQTQYMSQIAVPSPQQPLVGMRYAGMLGGS